MDGGLAPAAVPGGQRRLLQRRLTGAGSAHPQSAEVITELHQMRFARAIGCPSRNITRMSAISCNLLAILAFNK